MAERVERLRASDFEEAMDFLNMVFSMHYGPTNFEHILPKLYKATDEHMRCNFAIRKDGKIRGIVGVFPMTFMVNGTPIKIGGIGGVATHPRDRNSGMMKELMKACTESMREDGFHLSCLSGIRQRYQFYGYEKAGNALRMDIKNHNIKHGIKENEISKITFEILEGTKKDWLKSAKELYDKQIVYCERAQEEFYLFLKSGNATPYAGFDEAGKMVGYLIINKGNNQITEVVAESNESFKSMIATWVLNSPVEVITVIMPLWEKEKIHILGDICENSSLSGCGSWRVFNWAETLNALFTVKAAQTVLLDGNVTIEIANHCTVNINVSNGVVNCQEVHLVPDVTLDEFTATRLILGYLSPEFVTRLQERVNTLFTSWFPLPLYISTQDKV